MQASARPNGGQVQKEPILWKAKAGCRLGPSSEPLKEQRFRQRVGVNEARQNGPSSEPLKEENLGQEWISEQGLTTL